MTPSEAATLLAVAASFDRRTVGKADAAAWAVILADFSFDEARDAVVAHYAESSDWLMPSHVIALVVSRRARPATHTWCGSCDRRTRQIEHPDTGVPARCPACHPRTRKATA